jgi:transmembrane sensor
MSTNTKPPLPKPNRQILDEASAWFVEFRVGDADLDSRAEFDRWLRQSPEHIRAYLETARAYHELSALDSERVAKLSELISGAQRDENVLRLEPNAPDEPASGPVPSTRTKLRRWIPASIAAAVAAGLVIWITLPKYPIYSTGVGENRTITMPDASTITLNAATKIKVKYTKTERVIDLVAGQAFFQVAANKYRPFVVRSGFAVVRDVGTQFDVDRTAGNTTVTVVEGLVALYSASSPRNGSTLPPEPPQDSGRSPAVFLAAGEQAVVSAHEISTQTHANIGAATSWLKHRFIFDGSPLSDVVDQFNRYNSRQIIIDDAALDGLRISGVYSSTDPDSFLRFLGTQPGIEVTQADGTIHIDRK